MTPLRHSTYKSLLMRLLVILFKPPKSTTNWSSTTAECAMRLSNCFLIRLPAPEPWMYRGGFNSNHRLRCESKIQTSLKLLLLVSASSSESSSSPPARPSEFSAELAYCFFWAAGLSVLIIVVAARDCGFSMGNVEFFVRLGTAI